MKLQKGLIFFFILILCLNLVSSVNNVVVNQPTVEKKGWFDTYFGFFKNPIFWYFVVGFIILMLVLVGIFFLVRYLVKYLKSRNDIFFQLKKERMQLAKVHQTYPSKHWYKVHKNTPIRLVKKNQEGKAFVSQPVAYHRGDYLSNEGNLIISMNLVTKKKWWFFPITDILIIPDRQEVTVLQKDDKGKSKEVTIANLPRVKDIVQFNGNEMLIYAESIAYTGMFYIPVLKASNGKIIDLSLPTYQSLRDVVVGDYLFTQSDEFMKISKKSVDMNPNQIYARKVSDSNQSTEVPSGVQ